MRCSAASRAGRPFFAYLVLGANHAPLHAPKEFITKYRGRFDHGWDKVREETFERQKKLGIVPQDAKLTPRDPMIKAWADLNATQKKVYYRLQETYAGSWPAKIKDKGAFWPASAGSSAGGVSSSRTASSITSTTT